jgi:5-(carboxyamino)imidazole ribonucleotide synthase
VDKPLPEPSPEAEARRRGRKVSTAAPVIGIVGGGQLAWMLAAAARELGVELQVQTPGADDPATRLAAGVVWADLGDVTATRELARRCDAISFENEWIALDALEPLAREGIRFVPGLDALRPLLCKRSQRQLLNDLQLPCPHWSPLEAVLPSQAPIDKDGGQGAFAPFTEAAEYGAVIAAPPPLLPPWPPIPQLPEGFHFPVMAKATVGGYDGKGTIPLPDQQALEELLQRVDPSDWILEEMVGFEQELALVACRDRDGTVVCYPLVQTHQRSQVCDWVLFPAPVNHAVAAFARNVAVSLLTALDYVGVMGIEFFYGPTGLQVNELAPRTHNSGHYTIEACRCSQFSQQVRIVAGLPMGIPDPVVAGALMVNLLGYETADGAAADYAGQRRSLQSLPSAHLHWYGKSSSIPGRKLGHLTLLLRGGTAEERAQEAERRLAEVRALWPLPPGPEQPLE